MGVVPTKIKAELGGTDMQTVTRYARRFFVAGASGVVLLAGSASAQWPQWGGPNRDFRSPATGLAEEWPEAGPRRIWQRALGAGYSSIVADGGRLFTMYRSENDEVVVALSAKTGATEWEHKYWTTKSEPPNSTPTVEGSRLYTLGISGLLCALDKNSGKLAWSHDLVQEYEAKPPEYGFATSPLAYGGSLILPVGGAGYGVAAFALADGKLLWHKHDFVEAYASPILIEVEGEAQVVVLVADRIVGLSPETGELLWSEPIEGSQNIATPIWCSDKVLCVTAGSGGSFGLRFTKADGKTRVEKVWKNEKLQIAQTTVVRAGEFFYGSTGQDPFFVTAIHAKTGEVAWQERGFSLANLVSADGKLLLLDVEGVLALGTASPDAWKVKSKASLLEAQAFTAPTLDGKSLYLRDLKNILAIDLGKPN
jgi:outer membrane protein assembly factor BamB